MTRTEIIQAAYKVWGREFYLNTSLSQVARELGVSKPALYRHFCGKQALQDAMTGYFIDFFADFIREDYEKALKNEDKIESVHLLIGKSAEFYARNVHFFVFSMVKLYDHKRKDSDLTEKLRLRGVDFQLFHLSSDEKCRFRPMVLRFIFSTLTFFMANFHKTAKSFINPPSEAAVSAIITDIRDIIGGGLGCSSADIGGMDLEELESRVTGTLSATEDNHLLKAVAGAVAEAGPWDASMEQVARRSGLSKSSLYGHFRNKQDMLRKLFLTESLRIIEFSRRGMRQSVVPLEQLYLGIFSIVEYLRTRPDILVALDWIRNRKLDLNPPENKEEKLPVEITRLFEDTIGKPLWNEESPLNKAATGDDGPMSPWILFLIINMLMRKDSSGPPGPVPVNDIRELFRFITLGIRGFEL